MPRQCGVFPCVPNSSSFPLVGAHCHYTVIDVQTVASLVQTYVSNSSGDAQSVVYVFPLPAEAAVCAFKAVIDGTRIVKGVVQEKSVAKENYEKAVKEGKTAGLLEKQHEDGNLCHFTYASTYDSHHARLAFQICLGNIQPNQRINIQYVDPRPFSFRTLLTDTC